MRSLALRLAIGAMATFFIPLLWGQERAQSAYFDPTESDRSIGIYGNGETVRFSLGLLNPQKEKLEGRMSWRVDGWGKTAEDMPGAIGSESVSLSPSARHVFEFSYLPIRSGWHEIKLKLHNNRGDLLAEFRRTFSAGAPIRSPGRDFRYGVCTHLRRTAGSPLLAKEIALIEKLGVDIVRTELFSWNGVEPEPGRWDFSKTDEVFAAIEPVGVEIQHLLNYTAKWASTGDTKAKDWRVWGMTAPRIEPWLNYVRTVATRYGDRARYWEIWNEPDIEFWRAPTSKYIELFNATSALIKKTRPSAKVINGGLAMFPQPRNPDFSERFVGEADKAHWDIFAYHDYHTFANFLSRRAKVGVLQEKLPNSMPLWVNEGGFHTLHSNGESTQALTLVKKISTAPALGVTGYFWYNLRDDGLNPHDTEHHFGLTYNNGQPKPAWSAYQNLIRELGAARYLRSMPAGDSSGGVWGHLYERPSGEESSHVLVLWQEGASRLIPNWLDAGPDAKVVKVADIMGNPAKSSIAQNGAVIALTNEPVYVHIRSTKPNGPELKLSPMLDAPPMAVLTPGQATNFSLELNNPFKTAVAATLTWAHNVPGLKISGEESRTELGPRGSEKVSAKLELGPDNIGGVKGSRIELTLSFPAMGLVWPAYIPAVIATPLAKASGKIADIRQLTPTPLRGRDAVYNLYSAQPRPDMHWSGEDDLSGDARAYFNDDGLGLLVEVRDDIHTQKDVGQNLWRGDSLQLGLRLNETDADFLEIGISRADDGKVDDWIYSRSGKADLPLGRLPETVTRTVTRNPAEKTTIYHLQIPWSSLGLKSPTSNGFRLNFIVNDNDGGGRKQWLRLAEGLGDQKTPDLWPIFVCRD